MRDPASRHRSVLLAGLYVLALAGCLWSWRTHPPVAKAGAVGQNAPGDLPRVLAELAVGGALAFATLQPWARRPRAAWTRAGGVVLASWGVLRLAAGLHSPPVALPLTGAFLIGGALLGWWGRAAVSDMPASARGT